MTNKKFLESKKFIFGLIAIISSVATFVFSVIMICKFPEKASEITNVISIYMPASFTFFSILVGGQSFVDHKIAANNSKDSDNLDDSKDDSKN